MPSALLAIEVHALANLTVHRNSRIFSTMSQPNDLISAYI
jgi:hypothetical protein